MNTYNILIEKQFLNPFLLYEFLGVLNAIKSETISPDIGIWSLGIPKLINSLKKNKLFDKEILDMLAQCDELSAIKKLSGKEEMNNQIDIFIEIIMKHLKKLKEQNIKFDIQN